MLIVLRRQTVVDCGHDKIIQVWRSRAYDMRARYEASVEERNRLLDDNRRLAEKLVEVATQPRPLPEPIDIAAILEQFRRTVQPEVIVNARPDAADEQRAGIVWADQGLDNSGGTPENVPAHERDTLSGIPDYVLDIERLDPDQVKGTRGGWYNPTQPAAPRTNNNGR